MGYDLELGRYTLPDHSSSVSVHGVTSFPARQGCLVNGVGVMEGWEAKGTARSLW